MDRDQLVDLARRALKLARDKTTDLAPAEYTVRADTYTSAERHARDTAMLLASPQLVGYVSELPKPGSYCTKTVMGRSILLTRTSDGSVKAFDNVCLHRQSQIAEGAVRRADCLSVPRMELRPRRQPGRRAGQGGVPRIISARRAIDRAPGDRVRGLPLGGPRPKRHSRYPRLPRPPRRRAGVVGHRALGAPRREGAGHGDQLEARNRHLRGELPLRDRAQDHLRDHRASNCTVFDSFGPHHRLVFPLNGILDLEDVPDHEWNPLQNMVVIYVLFPNIVLSATIANGELFRVYPGDVPGRSITVHQNSTPLDLSEESVAAGAQAVFEYAHGTVRDEDYALVEKLQFNLASGVRDHLVFGRNEPGLQHRHQTWTEAISR